MATAVAIRDSQTSQWDEPEMVRTLRDTVAKGASDAQFRMFVEICKMTGLNPLLREIWFVPGVGILAARDGYLRVANEHPQFDGMETRVERDDQMLPVKAVCTVWRKDRTHPTIAEAYYNEYKKPSAVWQTYKSAMIAKVAEVLALKRSFSINGVVTEEEIGDQSPARGNWTDGASTAKQLGEAKVAALRGGSTRQEVEQIHDAEFVIPAEPPAPTLEEELVASVENAGWIARMMPAFEAIKQKLGEEEYRDIMCRAGHPHKQHLMKAGRAEAVRVYRLLSARFVDDSLFATEPAA